MFIIGYIVAQFFSIHPENPQARLIRQAAELMRAGGVIAYPTDSCYALGCQIGDNAALERVRAIREVDQRHHFALMCRNLAELGLYANLDNQQFGLLKQLTPGPYAFILRASREVPKRLQHPRRRTIGLRVPDHAIVQAMLAELDQPMLSSTLLLPGDDVPLSDAHEVRARLERQVDLVIDGGPCGTEPTTVIDLTGAAPVVTRVGKGSIALLAA